MCLLFLCTSPAVWHQYMSKEAAQPQSARQCGFANGAG